MYYDEQWGTDVPYRKETMTEEPHSFGGIFIIILTLALVAMVALVGSRIWESQEAVPSEQSEISTKKGKSSQLVKTATGDYADPESCWLAKAKKDDRMVRADAIYMVESVYSYSSGEIFEIQVICEDNRRNRVLQVLKTGEYTVVSEAWPKN